MRSGRRALLGSLVRRRIAFSLSPLGSPGDGHLRPIKKIGSKYNTNVLCLTDMEAHDLPKPFANWLDSAFVACTIAAIIIVYRHKQQQLCKCVLPVELMCLIGSYCLTPVLRAASEHTSSCRHQEAGFQAML